MFTAGHRFQRGHWFLSLLTIGVLSALGWGIQQALMANAPPLEATVAVALFTGAVVTMAFERWNASGHACFTAAFLAITSHLIYSIYVLIVAQLGPWSMVFGVVLFLLQFLAMTLMLIHTFEIIDVLCRTQWVRRSGPKRLPGYAPKVSIHVPIHREPPDMVIKTLNALAKLDYWNFEVLVIDNNTDDEDLWRPVERHCAYLGPRFSFFHLLPWPGFKSGALNFALKQTAVDAEIIGIVDADYLVEPAWLSDLTGYFADPKMAFVQTPQDYVDTKTRGIYGKALALSYIYFFRISMATRNESNSIIFAGTMGLLRKSALERVGGWDEWCITEDAEVSIRLLDMGYQSVYIDQTYGRGMMPMDYAGLKKQRFRWAFGGMQLLRVHAGKLFNPWAKGELTFGQRWAYLTGGMQWLNDPLTLAFTVLLLIGAGTLLTIGSLGVQPFAGAILFVPPVFLLFAVARFLWALRVREGCTFMDALRALFVLLGLTWVVTLACLRGLFSREGVFLRTPKLGDVATLSDSIAVVRWEIFIGLVCLVMAATLITAAPFELHSVRTVVTMLLVWQAAIFLAALLTSLWDYLARRETPAKPRFVFNTLDSVLGPMVTERQTAFWIGIAGMLLAQLMYLAVARAPVLERLFWTDPLKQFIVPTSALSVDNKAKAASILVVEADAARRGDVEKALALWHRDGSIVDENFTPKDKSDDRVWKGLDGLRERYQEEFGKRHYLSLFHPNMHVSLNGDDVVIVNDIDAKIVDSLSSDPQHVRLRQSDRWQLRYIEGKWQIIKLEVNRAPKGSTAQLNIGEKL